VAKHTIAVIPGDGIGKEVVPEGLRVLDAAARKFSFALQLDHFDWSCDYYLKHGTMMPGGWTEQIGGHDAISFGAVGWPAKVLDHVSLWVSLINFLRDFGPAAYHSAAEYAQAVGAPRNTLAVRLIRRRRCLRPPPIPPFRGQARRAALRGH